MPWPYISSRNKASSSTPRSSSSGSALDVIDRNIADGDDDDNALAIGRLSLDEGEVEGTRSNSTRRGASLDLSRASLNALTPFTSSQQPANKTRRSSFPRLALPSWRQQSPSSPSSSRNIKGSTSSPSASRSLHSSSRRASLALDDGSDNDDEDQGVELQEGYGTPYTATGLKGGFQLSNPTSNTLSGSSSIASTSSSSRKSQSSNLFSLLSGSSGSRTSSDEYSLESPHNQDNAVTDGKGKVAQREEIPDGEFLTRQTRSGRPTVLDRPVDSGFSEFGPHSVVEQEEERLRSSDKDDGGSRNVRDVVMHPSSSSSGDKQESSNRIDDGDSSGVSTPKKAHSRGWFSFNSNAKQAEASQAEESTASTPKNERDAIPSAAESIAETYSSGSTTTETGAPQQPTSATSTVSQAPPTMPSKKTKQNASGGSGKGFSIMKSAGRKRGDSEVSMKEMTNLS